MNIYKQLAEGGGYNLPFLVHLSNSDNSLDIFLINDNQNLNYKGQFYSASNFTFTPNTTGDSSFSVELVEHNEIIDMLEDNYYFKVEVIGIFNGEEIEPIGLFKHKYGEATWDEVRHETKQR